MNVPATPERASVPPLLTGPRWPTVLLAVCGLLGAGITHGQEWRELVREDPSKIMTAERCGECHVAEAEVWKKTPHATGFKTLHRKDSAAAIAERMGISLIKRDSPCLTCHYTTQEERGQLRAVSGVSCESCHGAGKDWIDIHNDYGGKGFDHTNESAEHRARRIADSRAGGMRRPSDLYDVVTSCYACHTVPNERLVNVGKHSIGSADFEFVEWSQGQIRHNFLDSFLNGDGNDNAERSAERKRVMYVVGRAVELENSLRGVAAATEEGVYLKAMQRRVRTALSEVRAIARRGSVPEVETMVAALQGLRASLGKGAEVRAAADRIGEAARQFVSGADGALLASLDPLVLGTADDEDFEDEELAEDEPSDEATAVASAAGDPAAVPPPGTPSSATPGAAASTASAAIPAEGEKKTHIRPRSRFATLSAAACQSCHGEQNAWWVDDPHYAAVEPFFDQAPKTVQIARLYGLKTSQLLRGNTICMDCHGTVVTGKEKREVQDGVGCQSCHGPAKDYLEIHQEGDKADGANRSGYLEALGLGMRKLKNLDVRASTCTGCHYVTDPRLLSAGHPSGKNFDYVAGMEQIAHWSGPGADSGALTGAFRTVLAARGTVPEVRFARFASASGSGGASAVGTADVGTAGGAAVSTGSASRRPRPLRHRPPRPRPVDPRSVPDVRDVGQLELPPFPDITEETSVEDILLLIQERLRLLYETVEQ